MDLFNIKKKSENNKFGTFFPPNNWKRRPSEIRGYHRAIYMTTDEGDYLRVDYNIPERKVRLYIELEQEGGNVYYSVITDGRITSEKSVASGRYYGFSSKFKQRARYFATISNKDILRIIGKNYDINKATSERRNKPETRQRIEQTKKRYFKNQRRNNNVDYFDDEYLDERNYFWDIFDMFLGLGIGFSVFMFFGYSFISLGIICAFYGIIIGFVDMFIRERDPLFIKILLFIIIGFTSYIYGYFF